MDSPLRIGFFEQEIQSKADLTTLEGIISKFSDSITFISLEFTDFFSEKNNNIQNITKELDFLIIFEDHTLLLHTNFAKNIPPLIVVELPGSHVFFSSIRLDQLSVALRLLSKNDYQTSNREMLYIEVGKIEELALNDFYLTSTYTNSRLRFELLVNHQHLFDTADSSNAVLISTPTGFDEMFPSF